MWQLGIWFRGSCGGVGMAIGQAGLEVLFQPDDSVIL